MDAPSGTVTQRLLTWVEPHNPPQCICKHCESAVWINTEHLTQTRGIQISLIFWHKRLHCAEKHRSIHPSIHPSLCLSIHPSVRLSIYLSVRPSIHSSICLSISLSVHPSISVCPSILSSIHLSVFLSIHPSIHPIHPSFCLFIQPSAHPSIHPSISLSLSICPSVHPSILATTWKS